MQSKEQMQEVGISKGKPPDKQTLKSTLRVKQKAMADEAQGSRT